MKARLLFVLLVLMATLATPAIAEAQAPPAPTNPAQLPQRQATFSWEKQEKGPDLLVASFSYVDVIDAAFRNKLSTGIPHVIVMRAYFYREGDAEPLALAARTCRITYDLWEEVYRLKISGPGGERDTAALNVDGVLRQCFEARKLQITDRTLVTAGKPHLLGVIVEVNPVNAQMVEQMRKWVTRPAGSTGIGPGDALFGSFVGLFVRNIGQAERTLRFRTQSFTP
ncbi:MAG: hypothetical protein QOI41_4130 [Myxococcales bacterium]|jgi:hypothetical protein|nr:hypothetical protein [Myxococcales bacterium]